VTVEAELSTIKRILAARANGALSRGPRTPEGKGRSSVNATRHGLLAKSVVLDNESEDAFRALVNQHFARFGPADEIEVAFIEEMATAFWRLRRAWAIETQLLQNGVDGSAEESEVARIAAAFAGLASTPPLGLLHRYEARLDRMYQRALHNLLLRALESPGGPPASTLLPAPTPVEEGMPTTIPKAA
jgi:hypothetical protein